MAIYGIYRTLLVYECAPKWFVDDSAYCSRAVYFDRELSEWSWKCPLLVKKFRMKKYRFDSNECFCRREWGFSSSWCVLLTILYGQVAEGKPTQSYKAFGLDRHWAYYDLQCGPVKLFCSDVRCFFVTTDLSGTGNTAERNGSTSHFSTSFMWLCEIISKIQLVQITLKISRIHRTNPCFSGRSEVSE